MSKELEALERLFQNLNSDEYCDKDLNHIIYGGNIDYKLVLKALTPPTAEEVSEALSEYWNKAVYYEGGMFIMQKNKSKRSSKDTMIVQLFTSGLKFYVNLPPYLLEMIAKFYKGVKE